MKRLLTLAAALAISGTALAQSPDPEAIESSMEAGGQRAAGWTRAAMEAATAAEVPNVNPEAVRSAVRRLREGRPAGEPGGTPEADAAPSAPGERVSGDVRNRPLYWAGKLFFTKPGNEDFVCSGQFISDNVVLTAAHCVRDSQTGAWYSNIAFALQYENGQYSKLYGTRCSATLSGWVSQDESKWNYDFATILVDAPSRTGHFGTRWNWAGLYDRGTKIGYPVAIENGQVIQVERGPIRIDDAIVEMHHANPNPQGGSSGGAWIGDYNETSGTEGNRVITVQSFSYEGLAGYGYGPYLGDSFRKLWLYTENGCR